MLSFAHSNATFLVNRFIAPELNLYTDIHYLLKLQFAFKLKGLKEGKIPLEEA